MGTVLMFSLHQGMAKGGPWAETGLRVIFFKILLILIEVICSQVSPQTKCDRVSRYEVILFKYSLFWLSCGQFAVYKLL